MIKNMRLKCLECGNLWDGYTMGFFTPRWCPGCKAVKLAERAAKERKKRGIATDDDLRLIASSAKATDSEGLTMEELDCRVCGRFWERPKTRGRKPVMCPDCKERENE